MFGICLGLGLVLGYRDYLAFALIVEVIINCQTWHNLSFTKDGSML